MTIGNIYQEQGMLLGNDLLQLVHLQLARGEVIPPHAHQGQEVFFTLISGAVEVSLNQSEIHQLSPGQVLHFAGEALVGVRAVEDSEFFVYLINR